MKFLLLFACCLSLTSCSKSNVQSSSSQPVQPVQAGAAKQETASPSPTDLGDKWLRSELADQMDGKKTVTFAMPAKNKLAGSGGEMTPLLSIACTDKEDTLIYIETAVLQSGNVRTKFDDGQPIEEKWLTRGEVIGPPPTRHLLNPLLNAKLFKVEVTPVGTYAQVITFNLANLSEVVNQDKRCKI